VKYRRGGGRGEEGLEDIVQWEKVFYSSDEEVWSDEEERVDGGSKVEGGSGEDLRCAEPILTPLISCCCGCRGGEP